MDPPPPPPPPRDEDLERRKHSTTNSMFTGSTIGKPNVDSIVHAVATILHSQMLEVSPQSLTITKDQNQQNDIPEDSDLYFFSEEKYIKEKPEAFDKERIQLLRETPSVESIVEFMKALFDCA